MQLLRALTSLLTLASATVSLAVPDLSSQADLVSFQRRASGNHTLTDLVSWDKYSLMVKGQRVFVLSGEFHPWRLPAPELWRDIVQKAKAAGFNTISIYTHWGASNPSDGQLDFDHFRAIQPIIDLCSESGLWMVMRFGPYINAETSAGGIPGWVTTIKGELRTNATDYTAAWQGYVSHVSEITARNQITNGGPIIAVQVENEYYQRTGTWPGTDWQWNRAMYMQLLEDNLRDNGVVVPLMHNDAQPRGNYAFGPGAVDLYAWDSYPQSFDCTNPKVWKEIPTNWHTNQRFSPDSPIWVAEFQGGAFDPWGSKGGYAACEVLTGPDFERVFYKGLWAANVKLLNMYMLYGGTSWGGLAFPGVYSSYSYGCAISENRALTPKYQELKLQGLFMRSARDFYQTDWVHDSSTSPFQGPLWVTYLRNPVTEAGFNFVRHSNSSSFENDSFKLNVNSSIGYLDLPRYSGNMTLRGRDHKLIVTDFHFGANSSLLYSTASIMLATSIGGKDVLVVYGDLGESGGLEVAIKGNSSEPNLIGDMGVQWTNATTGHTTLNFSTEVPGYAAIEVSPSLLVLAMDTATASSFWSPTVPGNGSEFKEFYSFGTNETVLIGGPYLVRNVSMEGATELDIVGDLDASTPLIVYASPEVTSVSFNGIPVNVTRNAWGALEGSLVFEEIQQLAPPDLSSATWRYKDSLPEVKYGYDDSRWVDANHTKTNNPFPPFANNSGPHILYAGDYDFHTGNILWRGKFESQFANETGVELGVSGGWAFAASAWLNEDYLGYMWSNNGSDAPTINSTFAFPSGAVQEGENWVTVLQDHMGLFEAGNQGTPGGGQLDIKGPRGIQGYKLFPQGQTNFSSWKVQGHLGGSTNFPDKTRGVYNEGGLFAERAGWHLPGFDDSAWEVKSPVEGISAPGVGFYRTTFDLALPADVDAPLNVVFADSSAYLRSQIYINGYQFGKHIPAIGPQFIFPIPRGIVDTNGTNTLAVSLWGFSDSPEDLRLAGISLTFDNVTRGAVAAMATNNPAWSPRDSY